MTVSSLWKALNQSGCGKLVGAVLLANPSLNTAANIVVHQALGKPQTLAVDLSIWICESLTSHGMSEQHDNPALHLVFTRTMKLLQLGIKLIFVIEGKQRIRDFGSIESDTFRKRRSGTAFFNACNDSQQLLELLGVPVVRAKSEGEALCALLCQRGIVDGVISNDGDCLLFGAKVIYTKYSNENLDNGQVLRYELDSLRAVVDASDEPDIAAAVIGTVRLSRHDLISFAILTGSDLAGSGLEKVGYKKATRFIRKCQLDNPLTTATASLDEMKAWARAAKANVPLQDEASEKVKCCSRCTHGGSKRSHEKHGCEQCGTAAGVPCNRVTSDDRFRISLRAKALAMRPKFDPSQVLSAYMRPNENQIPMQLIGVSSSSLQMGQPRLSELMQSSLIVKGRSVEGSRAFVRQAVLRLLSRQVLLNSTEPPLAIGSSNAACLRVIRERPVPQAITKALAHNSLLCYEVSWVVNATASDSNGDGVDGFEYVTVEPQELVKRKYPDLIASFQKAEVERAKQGDGMKNQRRNFLKSFLFRAQDMEVKNLAADREQNRKKRKVGNDKKREGFFQNCVQLQVRDYQATLQKRRQGRKRRGSGGDDIGNLLRFARKPSQISPVKANVPQHDGKSSASQYSGRHFEQRLTRCKANLLPPSGSHTAPATPKADVELHCAMGGYQIEISPVESNRREFPPKHIFVRCD